MKKKNLETICIHGGWKPKKGESQQLPIFQSTTFRYETSDQMARLFDLKDNGYFYTRLANPTNDAVAQKIAALEGGVGAVLTSSGQAANFYAIFNICQAGDHFITANTIYGGTFNLFGVPSSIPNGMTSASKQLSVPIQNVSLAKPSPTLAVMYSTLSVLQRWPTNMVFLSLWTTPLPRQSTAVRLNGVATS